MEHSFISMRLRTRPGPAVNGHGVIPDPSISMMDSFCHVITGLVPGIPIGEARCSSNRDGRDKPGHGVEDVMIGISRPGRARQTSAGVNAWLG
jgi:hypothetical protein